MPRPARSQASPCRAGQSQSQACPGKPRPAPIRAPSPYSSPCRRARSPDSLSPSSRPRPTPCNSPRGQRRPPRQPAAKWSTHAVRPKLSKTQKRRLRRKREDGRRRLQLEAALDSVAATAAAKAARQMAAETGRAVAAVRPSRPAAQPDRVVRQTGSSASGSSTVAYLSDLSSISDSDTE